MAHLTRSQRDQIEVLVRAGKRQQEIADLIGCSQPTISRELARGSPPIYFSYRGHKAQVKAEQRHRSEHHWYDDPRVFRFVLELLRQRQSPEQIEGRMKRESPWHREHVISARTIYTWI